MTTKVIETATTRSDDEFAYLAYDYGRARAAEEHYEYIGDKDKYALATKYANVCLKQLQEGRCFQDEQGLVIKEQYAAFLAAGIAGLKYEDAWKLVAELEKLDFA